VRIVSLIPEATEILAAIGLGDEVVAVPPEDAHDADRLASILRATPPTLIFTSETHEGGGAPRSTVRRVVSSLRPRLDPRPAVFALEPHGLGEILSDVKTVGDAVGRQSTARALIEALRARIDAVSLRSARALAAGASRRVVCLHSIDPPLAAGWWLAELVGLAGGFDALDGIGRPPRAVTWDEIEAAGPDLIIRADLPTLPWPMLGANIGCADIPSIPTAPPTPLSAPERGLGGEVSPGPGAVDLLEQLAALILPPALATAGHR